MTKATNARERLVDSAVHLLHAGSYGSVSVNDLCAHAGVNKGSFYHFFPSKRDLALAALEAQWQIFSTGLFDQAFAADIPPLERFTRFFTLAASFHAERAVDGSLLGCPFGNVALEMATQDLLIRDTIRGIFARFCSYFERTLEDARAAGQIGEIDARATARRLFTYLEGVCLISKVDNDPQVFLEMGPGAIRLILQQDG
jgi:TetR/AcrR family transcriptional repressor of nem operon